MTKRPLLTFSDYRKKLCEIAKTAEKPPARLSLDEQLEALTTPTTEAASSPPKTRKKTHLVYRRRAIPLSQQAGTP